MWLGTKQPWSEWTKKVWTRLNNEPDRQLNWHKVTLSLKLLGVEMVV